RHLLRAGAHVLEEGRQVPCEADALLDRFHLPRDALDLPLAQRVEAPCGPVSLGVRSEHLQITDPDLALLTGQVSHRENFGADIYLHVAINSHDAPVVVRASPAQAASYPLDATVAFTPVPGKVLVFGPEGRRWRIAPEILVEKVA
ncbi:MAG: TOBE domain-containing protein, partial [Hyphomicrobiales bacterium]